MQREMNVNISYVLTPEAELANKEWIAKQGTSWPCPDLAATPLPGDLLQVGDDDAPMFEVVNRLFIWPSETELVIQVLLRDVSAPPVDRTS